MTLAADAGEETAVDVCPPDPDPRSLISDGPKEIPLPDVEDQSAPAENPDHSALATAREKPVEFWPTAAIRLAVESDDLRAWQRIASALKRDPYGRTARQVEEVLETASSHGITTALTEVLSRARAVLEADERAEVSRQVQQLLERSGLGHREFASRTGVTADDLTFYIEGTISPTAVRMVRMQRLAERFEKIREQRLNPDPASG